MASYIVTGASYGIGRAVAAELARRGFRVVAVARTRERLEALAEEAGGGVIAVAADLATSPGIAAVCDALEPEAPIAGIVHAAGSLVPLEPYRELDPAELVEHVRIHVAAPIALYQAVVRHHDIGRMVFIDSYSAATPRPGWSAYSVVKAAAQMAARCAAEELDDTDVIRLFPGAVNTQIVEQVLASGTQSAATFAEMLERGEFAEPAETARFVAALLVDSSDELIRSREVWDYNDPADRAVIG